jgi:hypothetical protein
MKYIYIYFIFLTGLLYANNVNAQDQRIRKDLDSGTIVISVNEELNNGNEFDQSSKPYQEVIVGVATGNKNPEKPSDLIVKEGICYIKVNAENGKIMKGDLITSSSVPGIGMKATKSGMVVGIAIEDATNEIGLIKCRVLIQYII